jgi:hypothetical protein
MAMASEAPAGEKLIENLLAKGWIEKREITANEVSYRLTDKVWQPRRRRFGFTIERRRAGNRRQ